MVVTGAVEVVCNSSQVPFILALHEPATVSEHLDQFVASRGNVKRPEPLSADPESRRVEFGRLHLYLDQPTDRAQKCSML
jgi:hypothetical protein